MPQLVTEQAPMAWSSIEVGRQANGRRGRLPVNPRHRCHPDARGFTSELIGRSPWSSKSALQVPLRWLRYGHRVAPFRPSERADGEP